MTKEQAVKLLKLMQSGARNAIRFTKNDKEISEEERKEDIEIYQEQLEALEMAIKALEQNNEEIYKAGYEDGVHDGYYSSLIEDGTEEKHFGKSYSETLNRVDNMPPVIPAHGTCKDCRYWYSDNGLTGSCYKRLNITRHDYDFHCADFLKGESDGN